jgi:hypothetical protein
MLATTLLPGRPKGKDPMTAADDARPPETARPIALIASLVLLALALGLVVMRMQPPPPKAADAPPDAFSAGRALAILQDLLAEELPHPVGSAQNDVVRERIVAHLDGLGYEVQVQETTGCRDRSANPTSCEQVKNVVTRLPGQQDGPALVLLAHYDSVPTGPGVADDGASVATIIEVARILKMEGPYRNPVILLLTDGEEAGLLGARAFVEEHPWAQDVGVVANLESRGSSGQSLMFETSPDNAWLIDAYASAVRRPVSNSLMYEIYRVMPNDTDLTAFKGAGIASLNFAFIEESIYYHTPGDNFAHLDLGSVQHQGDCVLAVARRLATMDLSVQPPGNAVYLDVLGLGIVKWPEAWTLPLNLVTALLLAGASWQLIRGRRLTVGALLLGLLSALLTVVASILLGIALTWLIRTVAGTPRPWRLHPLPTRAALWAGTLLCGLVVGSAFARRAGLWGLGLGAWLLWLILSLVLNFVLVGATAVVLTPTLWAALLLAVVVLSGLSRHPIAREVATLGGTLFAAAIWLPLALLFESALGLSVSPTVTLSIGLVVSTLSPVFALPRERAQVRRWLTFATLAVIVLVSILAVVRSA